MKNFLMLLCCIYSASLMAQYTVSDAATDLTNHSSFSIDDTAMDNAVSFTKMTSENCPTENGYGVSDCSFKELNRFMSMMEFPGTAYEYNVEDNCMVSFVGNSDGGTQDINVSDCSVALFGQAIKDHLSKFTWTPASKNGEPQDINVTFNVIFKTEM